MMLLLINKTFFFFERTKLVIMKGTHMGVNTVK